jgi:hypothetical protein
LKFSSGGWSRCGFGRLRTSYRYHHYEPDPSSCTASTQITPIYRACNTPRIPLSGMYLCWEWFRSCDHCEKRRCVSRQACCGATVPLICPTGSKTALPVTAPAGGLLRFRSTPPQVSYYILYLEAQQITPLQQNPNCITSWRIRMKPLEEVETKTKSPRSLPGASCTSPRPYRSSRALSFMRSLPVRVFVLCLEDWQYLCEGGINQLTFITTTSGISPLHRSTRQIQEDVRGNQR